MPIKRHATVKTPLAQELFLHSMTGSEALGRLFHYELTLACSDFDIEASALLGKSLTVKLETGADEPRYFNGVVAQFAYAGAHGRHALYRASLRPWLWLLSHDISNQVYRRISVPELAMSVFRSNGFSDVEPPQLSGTYKHRDFVVQYQESAFHFISRWLEHEGIYYYFKHSADAHTLCLADDSTTHAKVPGHEQLPFRPPTQAGRDAHDHVDAWREARRVTAGTYAVDAFDFRAPKAALFAHNPVPTEPAFDGYIFDAPTHYDEPQAGQHYARVRAEELASHQTTFEGSSNMRALSAGAVFELTGYPRRAMNGDYLLLETSYAIQAGELESGAAAAAPQVRCQLRAIRADVPFRPQRSTARPIVAGPQTAMVVGVAGSEICTDEYGRVRVQFHWDREHQRDAESSCWIRVAQPWAGAGFGFQFIPRVGQEVLVNFIDGDPDQPIVIGSTYNHDCMPPYPPAQQATRSGIRTRSSLGGGEDEYNELRFEDASGKEEVYVQAQRDLRELVKNDHHTSVRGHQRNTVEKDQSERVNGDQALLVEQNRRIEVRGHQRCIVDNKHTLIAGDAIEVQSFTSIRLVCGASSITIDDSKIVIAAAGQAQLVLDSKALLSAAAGSSVSLDDGVLAKSSLGAQAKLDMDALLAGMNATVSGSLTAQTVSGASSVKADPAGVCLTGVPMVKIN